MGSTVAVMNDLPFKADERERLLAAIRPADVIAVDPRDEAAVGAAGMAGMAGCSDAGEEVAEEGEPATSATNVATGSGSAGGVGGTTSSGFSRAYSTGMSSG